MVLTIKAKLFTLRPFRKGDERSLQESINHRDVYRYTLRIPYPYTLQHAKAWVKSCLSTYKKKSTTEVKFAIDINGGVAGGIGLREIDGHKAEVGYWLARKHWGKGIMTAALKLISNYGFRQLQLTRIYATVFAKNKASARVLEKAGFKYESRIKKHYKKDGRLSDALLYAKIK